LKIFLVFATIATVIFAEENKNIFLHLFNALLY